MNVISSFQTKTKNLHIITKNLTLSEWRSSLTRFFKDIKHNMSISFRLWTSYFSRLPKANNQSNSTMDFEEACPCSENNSTNTKEECVDGIPLLFKGGNFERPKLNRITMCNRNPKRDTVGSDDLTEEDFQLFREPIERETNIRAKRAPTWVSKEYASRYCAERIANTTVGKLCDNLGTDVQSLVDTCSADITVRISQTF